MISSVLSVCRDCNSKACAVKGVVAGLSEAMASGRPYICRAQEVQLC